MPILSVLAYGYRRGKGMDENNVQKHDFGVCTFSQKNNKKTQNAYQEYLAPILDGFDKY